MNYFDYSLVKTELVYVPVAALSWKGQFGMVQTWQHHMRGFCLLCERLHRMYPEKLDDGSAKISKGNSWLIDQTNQQYFKVYDNMNKWWIEQSECLVPGENLEVYNYIRG